MYGCVCVCVFVCVDAGMHVCIMYDTCMYNTVALQLWNFSNDCNQHKIQSMKSCVPMRHSRQSDSSH